MNAESPNRRMRATSVVMVFALAALAISAVLFLLPVSNPQVQSCGSPARFLLGAQPDATMVSADGTPIHGWDRKQIQHAYDNRCSVRVGRRAVPAGILLVSFWVLVVVAVVLGWNGRRSLRRQLT